MIPKDFFNVSRNLIPPGLRLLYADDFGIVMENLHKLVHPMSLPEPVYIPGNDGGYHERENLILYHVPEDDTGAFDTREE